MGSSCRAAGSGLGWFHTRKYGILLYECVCCTLITPFHKNTKRDTTPYVFNICCLVTVSRPALNMVKPLILVQIHHRVDMPGRFAKTFLSLQQCDFVDFSVY
jgi:hypothetical protein